MPQIGPEQEKEKKEFSPFSLKYAEKGALVGGIGGFLAVLGSNFIRKRPFFAGILQYPISIGLLAGIGYAAGKWRKRTYIVRDAVIDHYVELHPEDFAHFDKEQRKFKDVLLPWIPIRATR